MHDETFKYDERRVFFILRTFSVVKNWSFIKYLSIAVVVISRLRVCEM